MAIMVAVTTKNTEKTNARNRAVGAKAFTKYQGSQSSHYQGSAGSFNNNVPCPPSVQLEQQSVVASQIFRNVPVPGTVMVLMEWTTELKPLATGSKVAETYMVARA